VLAGVAVALPAGLLASGVSPEPRQAALAGGGLLVVALGICDDRFGLGAGIKFAVQLVAAFAAIGAGLTIDYVTDPISKESVGLPEWLAVAVTLFWILGITNAINLIDGLDGLASGAVLIASMALWWVARTHGDFYVMFISALMAGATLGFLRYNFPPARVFMGDTGSNFLGLVLAAASLLENRKGTAAVTLLFPLVAMGLPIADSLLAFVRRLVRGTPVFRADSEHIHHRLLRLGLSPRSALFVLWYLCLYLGVMAVVLAAMPREYAWMMLGLLALGLVFAFEVLEFIDRKLSGRDRDRDGGQH
jgi:UDP-GlcNAc:undecaprenyl-phosphate GlcNAc-1-phosphate transferase